MIFFNSVPAFRDASHQWRQRLYKLLDHKAGIASQHAECQLLQTSKADLLRERDPLQTWRSKHAHCQSQLSTGYPKTPPELGSHRLRAHSLITSDFRSRLRELLQGDCDGSQHAAAPVHVPAWKNLQEDLGGQNVWAESLCAGKTSACGLDTATPMSPSVNRSSIGTQRDYSSHEALHEARRKFPEDGSDCSNFNEDLKSGPEQSPSVTCTVFACGVEQSQTLENVKVR